MSAKPHRTVAVLLCLLAATAPASAQVPAAGGGLSDRGLDNLLAFARLYGYVRYFHPSDASPTSDWSAIAVEGARMVESAATPGTLAHALERAFAGAAPTVRVFETARPAPPPRVDHPSDSASTGVAFWRHDGVRMGMGEMYESRLMAVRAAQKPAEVPDPARPYRLDLPGGVSAWVPASLFVTLPANPGTGAREPVVDTAASRFSATDRAVRLAAIIISWNAVQHFYPYFDVLRTDWAGALRRGLERAALDADAEAFEGTLKRLMAELRDAHAGANIQPWRVVGAPPFDARWIEQRLVVTAVDSSIAGRLDPGDVIARFNGEPVDRALVRLDSLGSGATEPGVRFVATRTLLAGAPESAVTIEIEARGAKPRRAVELRRRLQPPPFERRPAIVAEMRPGIWYLDLTRASDSVYLAAVPQLSRARGIVFDLRGYPRTSPRFLRHLVADTTRWGARQMSVPTVLRPDRESMTFAAVGPWVIPPAPPRLTGSIVFLTDERAASYGESLLDLIEEHHLGVIVGSPSAGTNGSINPFLVPGGYRVAFTGMRVVRYDGRTLHGVGVVPSVRVAPTITGLRAGRDEVLEKGLEVLDQSVRRR